MRLAHYPWFFVWFIALPGIFTPALRPDARAAESLSWNTNTHRVSADIRSAPLVRVLERIAQRTSWQVFAEPNVDASISTKFDNLSSGDALRMLLGGVNFALVPQTNSRPRLYVFRSTQGNATLEVRPAGIGSDAQTPLAIPTELIVTLKPGTNIEALARALGAKITGRLESLHSYRLSFESEEAARAARDLLANNPDVESIDSNYSVERPRPTESLGNIPAPEFNLKLKEPSGDCTVIIGMPDTPVGSLGNDLDKFLLPSISVVGEVQKPVELTHGTAMAETILRGIQAGSSGNTSVKILPVDVYGSNPQTTTFDVAQGIFRAVNAGANVVNLSLGSPGDSTVLHKLIQQASQQGVVFFGAAGNEPVTTPTYPAAYPEVVAVTAGDRNGQIASYANRGSFVDLITPGTTVVPYRGQSYVISGTSAATAYASGLAAGLADASRNCPPQVIPTLRSKLGANVPGQ